MNNKTGGIKKNLKKALLVSVLSLSTFMGISQESHAFFGIFKKNKDKQESVLQVKGSDTIVNVSQAVAEAFMNKNKDARVAVTGGGSGTGIAGTINKTVDIGMASRNMSEKEWNQAKEAGLNIEEITIGFDGITLVVNKNNPVNNLSREEIRGIFVGEITNWKEVGGKDERILVLSRDSSSGTHVYFRDDVLRRGVKGATEEYSPNALFLPSNVALKQEVINTQGAIAYIGMGYMDDTVKSLSVDGIEPSFANVASKKYSIARGVYWYADKARTGTAKDLVDFMLSPEGQAIVKKEGFVPAR